MFCTTCGSNNVDGAKFCEKCGAELVANVVHAEARAVSDAAPEAQEASAAAPEQQAEPMADAVLPEQQVAPVADAVLPEQHAAPAADVAEPEPQAAPAADAPEPAWQAAPEAQVAPAPQFAPQAYAQTGQPAPFAAPGPAQQAAPFAASGPAQQAPFAAPAPAQQAPFAAPGPAQPAPQPKKGRKGLLIALIVLAALTVVASIVSLVTCNARNSNDQPNLDTMVKGAPAEIAPALEELDTVKLHGDMYYVRPEWKDAVKTIANAIDGTSSKGASNADAYKGKGVWALGLYQDTADGGIVNVKPADLLRKGDPTLVTILTFRALDNPTPEDILKIAQEVCKVDSLTLGYHPTATGKSVKGDAIYCYGMGEGPGTVISVQVREAQGVYEVMVDVFDADGFKQQMMRDKQRDFENDGAKWFEDQFTFPKK